MRPELLRAPISIIALATVTSASALAQQQTPSESAANREIVVMLEPGTLTLPSGGPASVGAASVSSTPLRAALGGLGTQSIRRAIPHWEQFLRAFPGIRVQARRKGHLTPPDAITDLSNLYVIQLADSAQVRGAMALLQRMSAVVGIAPNSMVRLNAIVEPPTEVHPDVKHRSGAKWFLSPNDPAFLNGNNWGFFSSTVPAADVNAVGAWNYQTGRSDVRIAFMDTGMEPNHPDFTGKIVASHDFVHDDDNAYPDYGQDHPDHGMGVAGVATARSNNSNGTAGLCGGDGSNPGCSIIAAKILGSGSIVNGISEWLGTSTNAADAIVWAASEGAKIISNSWCNDRASDWFLGGFFTTPMEPVHDAIRAAAQTNILVTAAMGNSGGQCKQDQPNQPVAPGLFSDVAMSVGATDFSGQRVTYANTGNIWASGTGPHISVVAPGRGHWSATLVENGLDPNGNGYSRPFAGTSEATPFVSGAAGLVWSEILDLGLPLTAYDVRRVIELTATDIESPGWDGGTGYGIIDAEKALEVLQPYNNTLSVINVSSQAGQDCAVYDQLMNWTWWGDWTTTFARRCEVRRTITFAVPYQQPPLIWGRPVNGGGITPSNPNSQVYYTGIVPGTITTTSVVLKTYVYAIYNQNGTFNQWYPFAPNQVSFSYAALGRLVPFAVTAGAPGLVTVKGTYSLSGYGNFPASNWLWNQSFNGGSYEFWSTNQYSQFVAYAGNYSLGWSLSAVRGADGQSNTGYSTTLVCIPYNSSTCEPNITMSSGSATTSGPTTPNSGTPGLRDIHFGAGLWISSDADTSAIQLYSLAGRHDAWSLGDPRPNAFGDQVAERERQLTLHGRLIRVTQSRSSVGLRITSIAVGLSGLEPRAQYRVSYAIDPDLGSSPADDRLEWIDSLQIVIVNDPDSGAIAYGWTASPTIRSLVREYGGRAPDPATGVQAFREQRSSTRVLGGTSDVRFTLTTSPLKADNAGGIQLVLVVGRGRTAPDAVAAVVEARRTVVSTVLADSSTNHYSLEVRQNLRELAPAFGLVRRIDSHILASLSGTAATADQVAHVRSEGVTSVLFDLSVPGASTPTSITIFDSRGRLVRHGLNEPLQPGSYAFTWNALADDGSRVAPGVYQIQVQAESLSRRANLVITR